MAIFKGSFLFLRALFCISGAKSPEHPCNFFLASIPLLNFPFKDICKWDLLPLKWPSCNQSLFLYTCMCAAYHKWTPALPKPTPANTLARCISDRASRSSGLFTALKTKTKFQIKHCICLSFTIKSGRLTHSVSFDTGIILQVEGTEPYKYLSDRVPKIAMQSKTELCIFKRN